MTWTWTRVTGEEKIWGLKVKGRRSLGTKININRLSRISSSERLTSNQDQHDQRPILHITVTSNTFHQPKLTVLWYVSACHIPFNQHWTLERRRRSLYFSGKLFFTLVNGLRHRGRPKRQWMDDIEEWSGCSYIQLKMSQDREQWRRKTIEWSSAVANRHRRWSTSEWVSEWMLV